MKLEISLETYLKENCAGSDKNETSRDIGPGMKHISIRYVTSNLFGT